jgi:IstB-like ATP binding N-terminal.
MLNQATLEKLHALKLTGMAAAYEKQLEEPEIRGLSFEERFGLLVDSTGRGGRTRPWHAA